MSLLPDPVSVYKAYLLTQAAVTAICATRIGTKVGGTLPAIRVFLVPAGAEKHFINATLQVDCYSADEEQAHLLARTVADVTWRMPEFTHAGAKVSGAIVLNGPWAAHEVQDEYRYSDTILFTAVPG